MYLIYNISIFDYYSYNHFNNLCSHIKLLLYNAVKIIFNDIIKYNIEDIINICKNNNIELIVSFIEYKNEIYNHINLLDNIEINDVNVYFSLFNKFKKIILNINYEVYLNNTFNETDIILINNIDEYNSPEKLNIFYEKKNIGIETENENDIWFNCFNINIFSIIHKFNISNNEWSFKQNNNNEITLQFINYIKRKQKTILITGVSGQDGSILVEYLLNTITHEDIIILGTIKSISVLKNQNLKQILNNKKFCPFILDLIDYNKTESIFKYLKPDYFINCAAQTNVYDKNNKNIETTFFVNTIAPLRHLEFINIHCKNCRYLSCGSSEEFGTINYSPQDLNHPYNPINIYGITKNTTHNLIKFYRNNYNLHCSHIILYNHESLRRSLNFVTRKITNKIAQIKMDIDNNKKPSPLQIGNIYGKRDWSCSNDFVKAFWKILNMDKPDDYILSSGKTHTIKDLLDVAFKYINITLKWNITKNALDIKAFHNDILLVEINPHYYRENDENRFFQGDNTETMKKLEWKNEISFESLIHNMVENDYKILLSKQL